MDTTNTHASINRTLAVINGGLNFKVDVQKAATLPKPKLLDQVRQAIRARHYSPKTEESYVHWISDSFSFTVNGIRPRWVKEKSRNFFQVSPANCE